jgi:hypothetical protein
MKKLVLILVLPVTCFAQSLLTDAPIPEAQARAIRAATNAQGLRDSVVGGLRHSINDLWSADYSANVETAAALGPRAGELFALYENFMGAIRALLLAAGDTGAVAELDALAARVPAHTLNADGTVTITPPPPPPEPEPEVITEPTPEPEPEGI